MSESTHLTGVVASALASEDDSGVSGVSGVARLEDDSTLLRIKNGTESLTSLLRDRFPLAAVSLCEDLTSGTNVVQLLFPSPEHRDRLAKDLAGRRTAPRVLWYLSLSSFAASALVFLVAIIRNVSAS